jgi:hypothetical protein
MTEAEAEAIINEGTWLRGSHETECSKCGLQARKHRHMIGPDGNVWWLELCEPRPGSKIRYIKP